MHSNASLHISEKTQRKKVMVLGNVNDDFLIRLKAVVDVYTLDANDYSCDVYLIQKLNSSMLAHLALACPSTVEEELILKVLLEGKQVLLLEEGIEFVCKRTTAHKNLWNLYQEYLEKIKLFGISLVTKEKILQMLGKSLAFTQVGDCYDWTNQKLILEKHFTERRLPANSVVKISKYCKITPLAQDYIRSHEIKIQIE